MKRIKKFIPGFTLIELLVVIAIIGILATIAVPAYQNYSIKSHFTEVISATAPYKLAVDTCYQTLGTLTGCSAGSNGVPTALADSNANSALASIAVTNGVITATASTNFGLNSQTYVLTPTVATGAGTGGANLLVWAATGTCSAAGYC